MLLIAKLQQQEKKTFNFFFFFLIFNFICVFIISLNFFASLFVNEILRPPPSRKKKLLESLHHGQPESLFWVASAASKRVPTIKCLRVIY